MNILKVQMSRMNILILGLRELIVLGQYLTILTAFKCAFIRDVVINTTAESTAKDGISADHINMILYLC